MYWLDRGHPECTLVFRLLGHLWNNLRDDYLEQGESIKDSMKLFWMRSWRMRLMFGWRRSERLLNTYRGLEWVSICVCGPWVRLAVWQKSQCIKEGRESASHCGLYCNHSLLFTFHFGCSAGPSKLTKGFSMKEPRYVCQVWGWNYLINNPRSLWGAPLPAYQ